MSSVSNQPPLKELSRSANATFSLRHLLERLSRKASLRPPSHHLEPTFPLQRRVHPELGGLVGKAVNLSAATAFNNETSPSSDTYHARRIGT